MPDGAKFTDTVYSHPPDRLQTAQRALQQKTASGAQSKPTRQRRGTNTSPVGHLGDFAPASGTAIGARTTHYNHGRQNGRYHQADITALGFPRRTPVD